MVLRRGLTVQDELCPKGVPVQRKSAKEARSLAWLISPPLDPKLLTVRNCWWIVDLKSITAVIAALDLQVIGPHVERT